MDSGILQCADQALASLRIETFDANMLPPFPGDQALASLRIETMASTRFRPSVTIRLSRACGLKQLYGTVISYIIGSGSREPAD